MPKEVILDVDVGVDDALAIMLATASPELTVRGITTVSGNVHVDKTSINALKVLEAIGIDRIPVTKGMGKPLVRELEVAEDFHGADGLGDTNLPGPRLELDSRHAVDFLIEETRNSPGDLSVVATAPLTNIATALQRDRDFVRNIKELVIMGGAYGVTPYGYGNMNPVAEFNIYVDPEAAKQVLNSGIQLTAVGLDLTTDPNASLNRQLFEQLEAAHSARAKLAAAVTKKLMSRYGFVHLHDPMAVAVTADPSLVTTKRYHVDVETVSDLTRGQTVADRRDWLPDSYKHPPNVNVCTGIDGKRFLRMFMERITS
jgi:inosine-uridine nucleoside N-ribohydrolase